MSECPSCRQPLEDAQLDELSFRLCKACHGMLMAHLDLTRVLDASWRAIPEKKAEETPFRAPDHWQKEPLRHCPDCRKPMEKYGYMGLAAVQIDRCDGCEIVWLDSNELQNMVLALAKTNYRLKQFQRTTQDTFNPMAGMLPPTPSAGRMWLFEEDEGDSTLALAQTVLGLLMRR